MRFHLQGFEKKIKRLKCQGLLQYIGYKKFSQEIWIGSLVRERIEGVMKENEYSLIM